MAQDIEAAAQLADAVTLDRGFSILATKQDFAREPAAEVAIGITIAVAADMTTAWVAIAPSEKEGKNMTKYFVIYLPKLLRMDLSDLNF